MLLSVLCAIDPKTVVAQERRQLLDEASGLSSVQLVNRATLSDKRYAISTRWIVVVRLATKQIAIVGDNGTSVGVFDSAGVFERRVGRAGGGPGEFRSINAILIGPGDSVHVFDSSLHRETVYDPSFRIVGSSRKVPSFTSAIIVGENLVVSEMLNSPLRVGFSLHVVGNDGNLKQSLGFPVKDFNANDETTIVRGLSTDPKRAFLLAVNPNRYEFELWTKELVHQRTFHRAVSWFPHSTGSMFFRGQVRPRPAFLGSSIDNQGRLWTSVLLPSKSWTPPRGQPSAREGNAPSISLPSYSRAFDTVFELVDLRTARVTASAKFTGWMGMIAGTELVWRARENDEGDFLLDLFALVPSRAVRSTSTPR